jgi:hypothetical protein
MPHTFGHTKSGAKRLNLAYKCTAMIGTTAKENISWAPSTYVAPPTLAGYGCPMGKKPLDGKTLEPYALHQPVSG